MLHVSLFTLLLLTYHNEVSSTPQHHLTKRSLDNLKHASQSIIKHETVKVAPIVPTRNVLVPINVRKQKGPLSIAVPHQLIVPNLHVIPITNVHRLHTNGVAHSSNITHSTQLLPVLFPVHHHLVPVHDLTVIPLHRVVQKNTQISFKLSNGANDGEESINSYRNPLGGYGAGWYYGGHGAGHGFHYAYG